MTTAIFLELDGTFVCEAGDERPLRTVFESELGTVEQAWLDHYDDRHARYLDEVAAEPRRQALADVCVEFDLTADPETLTDRLLRATTVTDAARSSLQKLATSNELGVLTDTPRVWTDRLLAHHDLAGQFDAVITAEEAGARKPDSALFDLGRERVSADEYVHVGPDYERDVRGARRAGFVPIHFENDEGPDFWETLNAMV